MNTQPQTLNVCEDFAAFLSMPTHARSLDLTNSTLIECIETKIKVKRRTNPTYHKQYFSLLKVFKEIQEEYKCTIYPDKINELFWSFFFPYLEAQGKKASTIRTLTAQLKCTLEWASLYGAKVDETYHDFTPPTYTKQQVALTPDDVSRIYHFDIDNVAVRPQHRKTLKKVRDMFCLLCNIGLRYSDAIRLTPEHFNNGIIDILQQKTKRPAHIDIVNMCVHRNMTFEILERYGYNAPYTCDLTQYDKYLHELMILCGFDNEKFKQETISNGKVETRISSKSDLITSHTGRRTFIVYNALRGKSTLEIMRASGHKTFEAFQKYLCYY